MPRLIALLILSLARLRLSSRLLRILPAPRLSTCARSQRCKFSFLWLIVVRKSPLRLFAGRRVEVVCESNIEGLALFDEAEELFSRDLPNALLKCILLFLGAEPRGPTIDN